MAQASVHFGAGALGRGLILPLLAESGVEICVADVDTAVVDNIRSEGGYPIAIYDRGRREDFFVPVSRAFALGRDDTALDDHLAETGFVTTSVQVGNLPSVVNRLARVWRSSTPVRTVVGCENLRKVGAHIRELFEKADSDVAARIASPDCVVDRICSASPPDLLIETERYTEWVVEAPTKAALRGPSIADDVDRLFFRKRYLVNTLADAVSFIGARKGYAFLHQAVTDTSIIEQVSPLLSLLRQHLVRAFGFGEEEVAEYQRLSIERLSNPSISRRIETVARDPWRKFGPSERFMEPMLSEQEAGADLSAAVRSMRDIMSSVEPDNAVLVASLASSWGDERSSELFARLTAKNGGPR